MKILMMKMNRNDFSEAVACDKCSSQRYQCKLQTLYTYLEKSLDTKNGLLSLLFEKRILTLKEKQRLDSVQCQLERNRKLIEMFLEFKTYMHYKLFLDCLVSTNQLQVKMELENLKSCSACNEISINHSENLTPELLEIGVISIPNSRAVIGLCVIKNNVYYICHMNPKIRVNSLKKPFINLSHLEINLPAVEGDFHFYDMVSWDDNFLIISDKALPGFWIVNVENKFINKVKLKDGNPLRMFISHYHNHNCKSLNNAVQVFNNFDDSDDEDNYHSISDENLILDLKNFDIYNPSLCNSKQFKDIVTCNIPTQDNINTSGKRLLVAVLDKKQYFLHVYSDPQNLSLDQKISLNISCEYTISNIVQKLDNGNFYVCFSKLDFRKLKSCTWYLAKYSPSGQLLVNYEFNYHSWVPRYISINNSDDSSTIYVVSRYSNEILTIGLSDDDIGNEVINLKKLKTKKNQFYLPSRICFAMNYTENTNGLNNLNDKGSLLLIGQGEIDDFNHSAISVMKLS